MWNGQQPQQGGGYPPPGAPGGFSFPSPQAPGGGYPSPPPGPYASPPAFPGAPGGYAPPPGPPGGHGGYAPPSGPPGGYGPPPGPPGGTGGYMPPPGPPAAGGYMPPPGPPAAGGYAPPHGPPGGPGGYPSPPAPGGHGAYAPSYSSAPGAPSNQYGTSPRPAPPPQGGYPGQQYHQSHPQGYGAPSPVPPQRAQQYPPPSGPPHMPPAQMQHYGPQVQGANHQMQQPFFQYSQCNGKKKALCIGINYVGQSGELRGCHNDARNLVQFLCRQYGYKKDDIVVLTDDNHNPRQIPTRANIIAAMQWLVRDAHPNDSLFFHYSGHGGQTKDRDGDEGDGFDEVIYPLDYERSGHIVDDDMHTIMVKPLPPGCRLTSIFDSCHSGSALDLPYIYSTEGKVKEPNLALEAGQGLYSAASSYMKGDMKGAISGVSSLFKTATGSTKKADDHAKRTRTSPADVISWSGCKDSQTSADTVEAGSATGAMSFAFIQALSANPQQTYSQLLNSLRGILRSKYSQKPQLSSSHPMDTNIMFIA